MTSVLDQRLQSYFLQLNEAEKKSVLLLLKTFLAGREKTDDHISLEQYNKEIDDAWAEAEAGNYITQEEMEKRQLNGEASKMAIGCTKLKANLVKI